MEFTKGILLEKKGNLVTVLTPDGEFRKIQLANIKADIGDEINIPAKDTAKRAIPLNKFIAAVAFAAVFILLFIPSVITEKNVNTQPVAYLSLDINPSVEMELDQNLKVLTVKSLNQDADEVTKNLSLKGLTAEKAVTLITDQAYKKGFLGKEKENAVFLALTPKDNSMPVSNIEEKVKKSAQGTLEKDNLGGLVQTVLTTPAIRQEAMAEGLSPGKYAILLEAINSGLDLTPDDLRKASIAMAVKSAGGELGELVGKAHQEKDIEKLAQKFRAKLKTENQTETNSENVDTQNNGILGLIKNKQQDSAKGKHKQSQVQMNRSKKENRKFTRPSVKNPEYPDYPEEPVRPGMNK